MLTINSPGVEISIARCVEEMVPVGCLEEMVRDPNARPFFFLFFFYQAFIVSRYKKLRAALAMEKSKTYKSKYSIKETIFLFHRHVTEGT